MDAADRTLEEIKRQLRARGIKEFAFVSKDPGPEYNVIHVVPRTRKTVRVAEV